MEYADLRTRLVGILDERRRTSGDPIVQKALHRVMSIAVWVLDQNKYKPHVDLPALRDMTLEEIDIYLNKMLAEGIGSQQEVRAVQEARELVADIWNQLIREAAQGGVKAAAKAD
ncbi:MAG TPA: hypothetical protein VIK98_04640 [Limnochordales bacterium]